MGNKLPKITYLFGAGASYGTVPLVNELQNDIEDFIKSLGTETFIFQADEVFDNEFYKKIKKNSIKAHFVEDLDWLLEQIKSHASIDTLAKKYFLTSKWHELHKLKICFSSYLILKQSQAIAHSRYDAFYAAILERNLRFPSNIKILSWNYDHQFEKSYAAYSGDDRIDSNQSHLNIVTQNCVHSISKEEFAILKLNGTSHILRNNGSEKFDYFPNFQTKVEKPFFELILDNYYRAREKVNNIYSGLCFAWERASQVDRDVITTAKELTNDTDVLVVIGYSFPYFNRVIDREIIGNMQGLEKVYFQDPNADNLKIKFQSIRLDITDLVSIKDTDQFFLPFEL